ncbi:MAG: pyridoxal-dependent decarboxylase [Haloarculaceae archaeon]
MRTDELPEAAFVAPDGSNAEAVRELSEGVLDAVLEALTTATDRSPLPEDPAVPDAAIPETGRSGDALLAETARAMEGSMNPHHPGYVGHMDTQPSLVSVLGDLVAAAVNNNMLSAEMSPVLSELEVGLCREFAETFGLGPEPGGVMTSGGSLANLQALAVARNRAFDAAETGLAGLDPVLFASEVAHTSLRKAAMLLGLGTDAVQPVPTDGDSRMDPDALDEAVEAARAGGSDPFCVVATAGTTTTGNVDPLGPIADASDDHDLWFHVDAAYGGVLVFSDRYRHLLDGIERADSVTFNPQKWCYVAKTCATLLLSDRTALEESFRVGAPYVDRGGTPNLGELTVQGTRHADVLKCWLTFGHLGRRGIERLVEESYRLTDYLVAGIEERGSLELVSTPETNIVCFRANPGNGTDPDALNAALREHLLGERDVYLSLPTYRGSKWLRVVLLNPQSDEAVLDRLLDGVDDFLGGGRDGTGQ